MLLQSPTVFFLTRGDLATKFAHSDELILLSWPITIRGVMQHIHTLTSSFSGKVLLVVSFSVLLSGRGLVWSDSESYGRARGASGQPNRLATDAVRSGARHPPSGVVTLC